MNNFEKTTSLANAFTKRYLLAVLIMASLATGAYYNMQSSVQSAEKNALLVNMAGKQRMLSQRILLDIHHLYQTKFGTMPSQIDLQSITQSLSQKVKEFSNANQQLSGAQNTEEVTQPLSRALSDLYFGHTNLSARVIGYANTARQTLNTKTAAALRVQIKALDKLSNSLLNDLDRAVLIYQHEGEQQIKAINQLEFLLWIATLTTLIFVVLLLFRPMTRQLKQYAEKEQALLDSLNQQVELRTLKLEQTNNKLSKLASHDPMTGIKNRLTLEQDIEQLLTQFHEHHQPFALAILDIDWFKKVNDENGHLFGDFVIKKFAKILQKHLRTGDQVYRVGGEEFVLVFNRISPDNFRHKLEQLRQAIADYSFTFNATTLKLTASFGGFHSNQFHVHNFQEILRLADDALYQSKFLGRNIVCMVDPKLHTAKNKLGKEPVISQFSDDQLNHLTNISQNIQSLLGYTLDSLINHEIKFQDIVYSQDWDLLEQLRTAAKNKQSYTINMRLIDHDAKIIITKVSLSCESGFQLSLQSVTDLAHQFNDNLLVHNFHAMLERTTDFIYFKDHNHVFTAGSQSLVDLTNIERREDMVGKTDYDIFEPDLADEYYILEKQIFNDQLEIAQKIQPFVDNNGNSGKVDNRKYPIKDNQGNIIGLFGIARIIE